MFNAAADSFLDRFGVRLGPLCIGDLLRQLVFFYLLALDVQLESVLSSTFERPRRPR